MAFGVSSLKGVFYVMGEQDKSVPGLDFRDGF